MWQAEDWEFCVFLPGTSLFLSGTFNLNAAFQWIRWVFSYPAKWFPHWGRIHLSLPTRKSPPFPWLPWDKAAEGSFQGQPKSLILQSCSAFQKCKYSLENVGTDQGWDRSLFYSLWFTFPGFFGGIGYFWSLFPNSSLLWHPASGLETSPPGFWDVKHSLNNQCLWINKGS